MTRENPFYLMGIWKKAIYDRLISVLTVYNLTSENGIQFDVKFVNELEFNFLGELRGKKYSVINICIFYSYGETPTIRIGYYNIANLIDHSKEYRELEEAFIDIDKVLRKFNLL